MKFTMLALLLLLAAPLEAQSDSASNVMARAVRAYQDLDFDFAVRLFRRVLSPPLAAQLDAAGRARALMYLGATEHYRGHPDSTIAVFRRLVALAPDQRPDTLVFPPEITRLYDGVRSAATVVAVTPPPQTPPPPPPPPPAPPAPPPQHAAEPVTANVAGLVSSVTTVSGSSAAVGFAGSVQVRHLELQVRYAQGGNDLVEGALAVRFLATPWLSMQLGPHARHFDTPLGAERWVTWRLGARGDVAIAGPGVRGYAMLWRSLALDVNLPSGSGSAHGGEIGVRTDVGHPPFWVAMSYGLEQAAVRDATRHETFKTLTLTVGVDRR
jgi:hypothetical protein